MAFIIGFILGVLAARFGNKYIEMGIEKVKGLFNKLDPEVTAKEETEAEKDTESK